MIKGKAKIQERVKAEYDCHCHGECCIIANKVFPEVCNHKDCATCQPIAPSKGNSLGEYEGKYNNILDTNRVAPPSKGKCKECGGTETSCPVLNSKIKVVPLTKCICKRLPDLTTTIWERNKDCKIHKNMGGGGSTKGDWEERFDKRFMNSVKCVSQLSGELKYFIRDLLVSSQHDNEILVKEKIVKERKRDWDRQKGIEWGFPGDPLHRSVKTYHECCKWWEELFDKVIERIKSKIC